MSGNDSYHRFYDTWFKQLHRLIEQLSQTNVSGDHKLARLLVEKVMTHNSEYYRVKSLTAESDVLSLFSATWASSLERSLHWVAGFRPTTLFHLIYTECSARFGSHLVEMLHRKRTGDLGELTPGQLGRVSYLQCETVKAENEITGRLSEWQEELVAVDWAAVCSEASAAEALEKRIGRLKAVVQAADDLRLETLRKVIEMLTPQQAAEFLVAASELLFGVRSWGLHQDRLRGVA